MFVERMKIVGLGYKVRRLQLQGSNTEELRGNDSNVILF